MGNPFAINSKSKNFHQQKAWTFEVESEKVEWRPEEPYLFALTPKASELIEEITEALSEQTRFELDPSGFKATPTGPYLLADLSNRHTVLFLVNLLFDYDVFFEEEELDENDSRDGLDYETPRVKYSRSAPKLETIFGPQDEGIIY